jgi:hypothetical protein
MIIIVTVLIVYNAVTCLRIDFTDTSYSFFTLIQSSIYLHSIDYAAGRIVDIKIVSDSK